MNVEELKKYKREWAMKYRRSLGKKPRTKLDPEIAKQRQKERVKKYILKNREKITTSQREYQRRIRIEVILKYGGKCVCCGESNIGFLTMDHIDGGGTKHRKKIKIQISQWIKKENYPKEFQVLCYNCNCGKAFNKNKGICPHKDLSTVPLA